MEYDENYLDDSEELLGVDTPNKTLGKVCDGLFFGTTELAGNVGLKSLGYIVSAPTQEFEAYLDAVNAPVMQEDEFLQ